MASELGIHPGRVRVRAYDASTSAVTLTFDDAPGDVPLDVVVSTLQVKLSSDTLLVDPSFGHILLTEVRWPEGWGEGKEKNSGVGGGVARSREHAQLEEEEEREEEEEAAEEAARNEAEVRARHAAALPRMLQVMGSVMTALGVSDDMFAPVCVIVDKLDKIGAEGVKKELLENTKLESDVADAVIATMSARSLEELQKACKGVDPAAIEEMQTLFKLAEGYGYADYLAFDASVVRGLAYYTGVVFEGFDPDAAP